MQVFQYASLCASVTVARCFVQQQSCVSLCNCCALFGAAAELCKYVQLLYGALCSGGSVQVCATVARCFVQRRSCASMCNSCALLCAAADVCKKMKQERAQRLTETERLRQDIKSLESEIRCWFSETTRARFFVLCGHTFNPRRGRQYSDNMRTFSFHFLSRSNLLRWADESISTELCRPAGMMLQGFQLSWANESI